MDKTLNEKEKVRQRNAKYVEDRAAWNKKNLFMTSYSIDEELDKELIDYIKRLEAAGEKHSDIIKVALRAFSDGRTVYREKDDDDAKERNASGTRRLKRSFSLHRTKDADLIEYLNEQREIGNNVSAIIRKALYAMKGR